jgi:threonine/homoserine/homoserine lactone efflux protein
MLFFQFINPKAVVFAIILVSTFIKTNENFLRDTVIVMSVAIIFSFVSILSWCLLGKFLRRFAKNKKFIQVFNYVMSFLLIVCIILIYL